jgi:flagellin
MSYILTNPSALSALQTLQQTQSQLKTVEGEVSSGLSVKSAADNAAYWSIATQLNSDSQVVGAANSALTQSQSVLDTATSAIDSVKSTIYSIQTALTEATNPGADISNIQTTLTALGTQLGNEVQGASFNGLNVLDGSQSAAATPAGPGTLQFVSGFNATATGGSVTTIAFATSALIGYDGTTTPNGTGILEGGTGSAAGGAGATNLLTLGTTVTDATTANTALAGVATVLNNLTNYAATIGAAQDQMSAASTFNSELTTNYANGVAGLVDANMNTASTQLQALQTQEQLGIQSLSIANQNSSLILKLFQ